MEIDNLYNIINLCKIDTIIDKKHIIYNYLDNKHIYIYELISKIKGTNDINILINNIGKIRIENNYILNIIKNLYYYIKKKSYFLEDHLVRQILKYAFNKENILLLNNFITDDKVDTLYPYLQNKFYYNINHKFLVYTYNIIKKYKKHDKSILKNSEKYYWPFILRQSFRSDINIHNFIMNESKNINFNIKHKFILHSIKENHYNFVKYVLYNMEIIEEEYKDYLIMSTLSKNINMVKLIEKNINSKINWIDIFHYYYTKLNKDIFNNKNIIITNYIFNKIETPLLVF